MAWSIYAIYFKFLFSKVDQVAQYTYRSYKVCCEEKQEKCNKQEKTVSW